MMRQKWCIVQLKWSEIDSTGIKLYHSHTNETPPSSDDLLPLLDEKVSQIAVISGNGDKWVVRIGDGWIPTQEEFKMALKEVRNEANATSERNPVFYDLELAEENYMAIREEFYLLTRRFGWYVMGEK